jgi:glycosyltransferase involved in cell wall biosynthesis
MTNVPVPLTLGSFVPYLRRPGANTEADRFGWFVAHHDVLEQAAKHGIVNEVHLFSAQIPGGVTTDPRSGAAELQAHSRAPVHAYDVSRLADLCASNNYIFLAKSSSLAPLSQLRSTMASARFPICAILYAVQSSDAFQRFLCTLLLTQPYDAIVTTSRASHAALCDALAQAEQCICERVGGRRIESPRCRLQHIPLAVDDAITEDSVDRADARRTLGLEPDTVAILWVGRFTEHYKADLSPLLLAFKTLLSEGTRTHLLLAGQDGPDGYSKRLGQLARDLAVGRHVTTLTSFQPFLKRLLYGAADIFVSPVDNVQESFGLSLLEAMGYGLPVVASDWSGYRDIVVDGDTGVLVRTMWACRDAGLANQLAAIYRPPAAESLLAAHTVVDIGQLTGALRLLATDAGRRHSMGRAARAHVRSNYVWSKICRRFGALWQELVCLSRETGRPRHHGALELARTFRHYASAMVSGTTRVRPSIAGRGALESNRLPVGLLPERHRQERAVELLRLAAEGLDVQTLAGGEDDGYDTVIWLLKKGYLQVDSIG